MSDKERLALLVEAAEKAAERLTGISMPVGEVAAAVVDAYVTLKVALREVRKE